MSTGVAPNPTIAVAPPHPRSAAVALRPSTHDDFAAIGVHFEHLDEEGRRLRFHGTTNAVPRAVLDVFRDADERVRITRLAVAGGVVLGEAMLVATPGTAEAELALSVAPRHRRDGIGRRLLSSLVAEAARVGLVSIHADVLPENAAFIALAGELGFAKRWHPQDPTVLRMTLAVGSRDAGARPAVATCARARGVEPRAVLARPRQHTRRHRPGESR